MLEAACHFTKHHLVGASGRNKSNQTLVALINTNCTVFCLVCVRRRSVASLVFLQVSTDLAALNRLEQPSYLALTLAISCVFEASTPLCLFS